MTADWKVGAMAYREVVTTVSELADARVGRWVAEKVARLAGMMASQLAV